MTPHDATGATQSPEPDREARRDRSDPGVAAERLARYADAICTPGERRVYAVIAVADAEQERLRNWQRQVCDLLGYDVEAVEAERDAAETERDALRAEVERLRSEAEAHALANSGCVPGAAYRDLTGELRRVESERDAARAENRALRERIAKVEALADKWEAQAGPSSDAWRVYGPQAISVPRAVESLRAAAEQPAEPGATPDGGA